MGVALPASDDEVIEVRRVQESEDFPADVQEATGGFFDAEDARSGDGGVDGG